MEFIDIDNGILFDGQPPYIFWFPNQQSTNIIYTMRIMFLSTKWGVNVNIPDNDVFKIININDIYDNINNFDNVLTNNYTSIGYKYQNKFIHNIYIKASSDNIGEFVEDIYIDGNVYNIGADFYNENESLYINLSNMGVEIPDSIQKAIYQSNIQEDYKDNILINRKMKELVSNYWDVIACKGSYKSLINSLNWFEYGDIVRIKEMWKRPMCGSTFMSDKDFKNVLNDVFDDVLNSSSKTTYLSLYHTLQRINNGDYDEEFNPTISMISDIWSKEDMSLKMSLLGHFYETYFMPIHQDILHSTIEDIVFTNSIKVKKDGRFDRLDEVNNFDYIKSNIDNRTYFLGNVETMVGPDTVMGVQWEPTMTYDTVYSIGVDTKNVNLYNDNDIKTFSSQFYNGVGVVIPVSLEIPIDHNIVNEGNTVVDRSDFIKQTNISINTGNGWVTKKFYKKFDNVSENNILKINFNILCTKEGEYDIRIMLLSGSSKTYTKRLKFEVIDPDNIGIKVYRLDHKYILDVNLNTFFDDDDQYEIFNKYMFRRQPYDKSHPDYYIQYLPISKDGGGMRTNHLLVLEGDYTNDNWIKSNYHIMTKTAKWSNLSVKESDIIKDGDEEFGDMDKLYTMCISKRFNFNPRSWLDSYLSSGRVCKNEYVFIPQFHTRHEVTGTKLEDFTIYDSMPVFISPDIKFGKFIEKYEWEFENASTLEKIILPSIQEPYVAETKEKLLPNGYYNIIFRYSLIDGQTKEIKLNSAFIKK